MAAIVDFLDWITDETEQGDHNRDLFYKNPGHILRREGVSDERDQDAICSVDEGEIIGYVAKRYGPQEAVRAKVYLDRIEPGSVGPHHPFKSLLGLDRDPWEGQACGSELPCSAMPASREVGMDQRILAGGGWGQPYRSIENVIPGSARVGDQIRLVVSGEGLRPTDLIVLEKTDGSGMVWSFEANLYCERAFAGVFVGRCIDVTPEMEGSYTVLVRDSHEDLRDVQCGHPFTVIS